MWFFVWFAAMVFIVFLVNHDNHRGLTMSISTAFEAEAMKLVVQEAHEDTFNTLKAFSVRVQNPPS